jgi:hypothetical protein
MTMVFWINGCSCFNAMHHSALEGLGTDLGDPIEALKVGDSLGPNARSWKHLY